MKNYILFLIFSFSSVLNAQKITQPVTISEIRQMIQEFKKDDRGPYQAIRWFCPDGTIILPKERCAEPGGIQHAILKDKVTSLAATNKIYLGQILAGSSFEEFWDTANGHSRIKQYILEKYLDSADDGWIMRRGKFYRGAIQAEDEADWGYRFLSSMVGNDEILEQEYFFLRQAFRSIPHNAADKLWERIRSTSKILSDTLETFTNIRVKLHGQPDQSDLAKVIRFREQNKSKITPDLQVHFEQLEDDLNEAYKPFNTDILKAYLKQIPKSNEIAIHLQKIINIIDDSGSDFNKNILKDITELLWLCRKEVAFLTKVSSRLSVFDLSISLETVLFQYSDQWEANTLGGLLEKGYSMVKALAAVGFLEIWEYEKIENIIKPPVEESITLKELLFKIEYIGRSIDWGSSMVRSHYLDVLNKFSEFEPLVFGFIDDRIRVSILLPAGNLARQLKDVYAEKAGISNSVLNISSQNQVHGLNSGYALGKLKIVENASHDMDFEADKIYVLAQPPSDLKPVSGLLTVSEGNLVSHVQLLARNLGIPNAVITDQSFNELLEFDGELVFYAVSPKGAVNIKLAEDMSDIETNLFSKVKAPDERFSVPLDKINIREKHIINLNTLRADSSGIYTGPKAANLGELKNLFPDNVVEGFALPFGVFRQHLDQQMPGSNGSYWEFLSNIFISADSLKNTGTEKELEKYILTQLAILRTAIKGIQFIPEFENEMAEAFENILGSPIGEVPVFIRSDTNMEDLKDFTGAGLNLTVFNVRDENAIWQGIRDVWASPFSERSYKWRQRLLLNPENVYPSILIIPSVDNEKSGVMITTGIYSGEEEDITVAFNRGSGGAVEGQIAESYTLKMNSEVFLLSPGREKQYMVLPESGGVTKTITTFVDPILSGMDLDYLHDFSKKVKNRMMQKKGFENNVPLDIELGIKESKIWLFQVRPFVESKKAKSSNYLNSMDPAIDTSQSIMLND